MTTPRLLPLLSILAALPLAAPLAARPPEPIIRMCSEICGPNSCDLSCQAGGATTTCAVYQGAPPNDYDSDGVPNNVDNCICKANANQANCDGDALGDACDPRDDSWTQISATPVCHIDVDNHVVYETMEMRGSRIYRSACTGQTCVKKVLYGSFNCYPSATLSCCDSHWSAFDCHGLPWNNDLCGTPRCTF